MNKKKVKAIFSYGELADALEHLQPPMRLSGFAILSLIRRETAKQFIERANHIVSEYRKFIRFQPPVPR